jgi:hypothetical protein
MIPSHIEKLKRDSRELGHFIQKMRKRGRSDVAGRLKAKKASIDSFVEQYTEESKQSYLVA